MSYAQILVDGEQLSPQCLRVLNTLRRLSDSRSPVGVFISYPFRDAVTKLHQLSLCEIVDKTFSGVYARISELGREVAEELDVLIALSGD